jgi:hypothetical protein
MIAVFYIGMLISVVTGIWLLVVAFKESIWWGLGSFFIPLVGLIFVIMHWQVAKKPFLWSLLGIVLIVVAAMAQPELMSGMT